MIVMCGTSTPIGSHSQYKQSLIRAILKLNVVVVLMHFS